MVDLCNECAKFAQKSQKKSLSHKLRTREGGFGHCACEHNSPELFILKQKKDHQVKISFFEKNQMQLKLLFI